MEYRELTEDERKQVPGLTPGIIGMGAVNTKGKVIACCGIIMVVHLDPMWVHPDSRGRAGFTLVGLWEAVRTKLKSLGAKSVTSSVIDGYPEPPYDKVIEHLSTSLAGGHEVKARIWLIPLEEDTLEKAEP